MTNISIIIQQSIFALILDIKKIVTRNIGDNTIRSRKFTQSFQGELITSGDQIILSYIKCSYYSTIIYMLTLSIVCMYLKYIYISIIILYSSKKYF